MDWWNEDSAAKKIVLIELDKISRDITEFSLSEDPEKDTDDFLVYLSNFIRQIREDVKKL